MPANGRYDLRLSLLDASAAKSIGSAITFSDVQVANGNFLSLIHISEPTRPY